MIPLNSHYKRKTWSVERCRALDRENRAGTSKKELALKHGVTTTRIQQVLKQYRQLICNEADDYLWLCVGKLKYLKCLEQKRYRLPTLALLVSEANKRKREST